MVRIESMESGKHSKQQDGKIVEIKKEELKIQHMNQTINKNVENSLESQEHLKENDNVDQHKKENQKKEKKQQIDQKKEKNTDLQGQQQTYLDEKNDSNQKKKENDEIHEEKRSSFFETRVETAEKKKKAGNELFKLKDWEGALKLYEKGLYHVGFDELQYNYELMDKHRAIVDASRLPLFLNAAACALKLEKNDQAIDFCTKAIKVDSDNAKALFRRAQAYLLQGYPEKAKPDLKRAAKKKPNDPLIRSELVKVIDILKEEDKKVKEFWKGKLLKKKNKKNSGDSTRNKNKKKTSGQIVSKNICWKLYSLILSLCKKKKN